MKTEKQREGRKPSVLELFSKGYDMVDEKRVEFYRTILNDLAEDVEIRGRLTVENLIEVCGHLQRENRRLCECYNERLYDITDLAMKALTAAKKTPGEAMEEIRKRDKQNIGD